MPTRDEKLKTIALVRQMIADQLTELFDEDTVEQMHRNSGFLDFVTGNVDWSQAPAEVQAKFTKQPTATEADFETALKEARESRKK